MDTGGRERRGGERGLPLAPPIQTPSEGHVSPRNAGVCQPREPSPELEHLTPWRQRARPGTVRKRVSVVEALGQRSFLAADGAG